MKNKIFRKEVNGKTHYYKTCSKCKTSKSVGEFYKRHNSSDGYDYWCKACKRGYTTLSEETGEDMVWRRNFITGQNNAKKACVVCNRSRSKPYRVTICRECWDKVVAPILVEATEESGFFRELLQYGKVPVYKPIRKAMGKGSTRERFSYIGMRESIGEGCYGRVDWT